MESGCAQPLTARRARDNGFRFHEKTELARRAVRHQIRVFRGLLARIGGLGGDVQTSQPFDAHIAFESRQQQPQWIALLRAQPLAILAVHQHRVFETFFDRNAARHRGGIGAFGDHPFCPGLQSCFLQNQFEAYAGPFGTAQETDKVGRRFAVGFLVARVARAFEEIDVRLGRKALDVVHGKDQRFVDEAVEHQSMLRRIDGGNPAMMAFIEQSVRRDDAVEILQRRPPGCRQILRQVLRDVLDDILFEWRGHSVKLASHRVARCLHPFRDIGRQVVGVFRCRRCFAARETTRNDDPSHHYATVTQKSPARCRGKTLAVVGWLVHRTSSARNRCGWNNAIKLSHVPEGRLLYCNSPSQVPLAEDCRACLNLADSVPSKGMPPATALT